ncbi:MAG: hypothetical protein EXQ47_00485 [Bryobacterales bacterium]|nr:hypothetical protein [Bryobacterales bacterium]
MRNKIVFALLVLGAAASVWAHHSTTAVFDVAKRVAVTGTLTKVDWVNPHIVVLVDAQGNHGNVDAWRFESNPPSWFRRVSVGRQDFAKAIGQTVVVEANPAKDGTLYGYLVRIKYQDGTSLEIVPEQSGKRETAAK